MRALALLLLASSALAAEAPPEPTLGALPVGPAPSLGSSASIVDEMPGLQKYLAHEPDTKFSFGAGISPVAFFHNRVGFSVNIFQIHWQSQRIDWEIFGALFGMSTTDATGISERTYTFRTVPKFRLGKSFSIGPLAGIEFVSFPDVTARLQKTLFTPPSSFSAVGPIFGGVISENFELSKQYQLKVNELIYKQTYSTAGTNNGWTYFYDRADLNQDQSPISPGWVFAFELSFIY